MNDYDLIDNILPQYHFLKEKCMKNMAVRGGAAELLATLQRYASVDKRYSPNSNLQL